MTNTKNYHQTETYLSRLSGLKVGVDGMNLALRKGTGVATYARALSRALKAMNYQVDVLYGMDIQRKVEPNLREVLFFEALGDDRRPSRPHFPSLQWWKENIQHLQGHTAFPIPITERVFQQPYADKLPAFDRIFNVPSLFQAASGFFRTTGHFLTVHIPKTPDIMHWTYPVPIKIAGAHNIYTIHDIVPLQLPNATLDNKRYYYSLLKKLSREGDAICTVSESSKRDIAAMFPDCENKLFNTYQTHSIDPRIANRPSTVTEQEIHTLFGVKADSYFIYFGLLEPKKNIGRLIKAFLESDTKRKLIMVGAQAWKAEEELRFLQRGVESERILHIQYLPADDLLALVRHARAVLFPSIAEGFGLPVLEAFSLGTPVLTSRNGALPEIAGDATLYVDAYDINSIRIGIERLDRDDALCLHLHKAGLHQKELFNMDRYKKRLHALYSSIAYTSKA